VGNVEPSQSNILLLVQSTSPHIDTYIYVVRGAVVVLALNLNLTQPVSSPHSLPCHWSFHWT
jgi:hypothetical protein